jgi:hypothetical protein
MQTEVDYGRAIRRIEEKIRFAEKKIADDPDDERKNFYSRLDVAVFQLCLDCLRFSRDYAAYEAYKDTQPQQN